MTTLVYSLPFSLFYPVRTGAPQGKETLARGLTIKSSRALTVSGAPEAPSRYLLDDSMNEQMLFDFSENSPNIGLAPDAPSLFLEPCSDKWVRRVWGYCTRGTLPLSPKISHAHRGIKGKHFVEPLETPIRIPLQRAGLFGMSNHCFGI